MTQKPTVASSCLCSPLVIGGSTSEMQAFVLTLLLFLVSPKAEEVGALQGLSINNLQKFGIDNVIAILVLQVLMDFCTMTEIHESLF